MHILVRVSQLSQIHSIAIYM